MSVRHHIAYGPGGAALVLRKLPWWFRALDRCYWVMDSLLRHRLCVHDAFNWFEREERLAVDHRVPLSDDAAGHDVAGFLWGHEPIEEDG